MTLTTNGSASGHLGSDGGAPVPAGAAPSNLDHDLLEDLLLRCAEQDQEAFVDLYRLTRPVFEALAVTRGQSRSSLESALTDIYATIWRQAGTFNYGNEGSAWTWTLAFLDETVATGDAPVGVSRARRPRRWF